MVKPQNYNLYPRKRSISFDFLLRRYFALKTGLFLCAGAWLLCWPLERMSSQNNQLADVAQVSEFNIERPLGTVTVGWWQGDQSPLVLVEKPQVLEIEYLSPRVWKNLKNKIWVNILCHADFYMPSW